jgi:hypothetical protein
VNIKSFCCFMFTLSDNIDRFIVPFLKFRDGGMLLDLPE